MITLYTFGPAFGQPDPSPFVVKAMVLLKMAGLDFTEDSHGFRRAPKGKLPYLDDDDQRIDDSTFIRFHIERKYGFDFDAALSPEQRAAGWAFEKMCEDHLYWALIDMRWLDQANFERGPAHFFARVPLPLRGFIKKSVQGKVKKNLWAHGLGRHSAAQKLELATRDIDAVAAWLGAKPYLFGELPGAADASVYAMISAALAPLFESPLRAAAERHPNLRAYCERMHERYFLARQ